MPERLIVVLARAPSAPGKTRLTSDLSSEQAASLRAALFLDTVDVARSLGAPVRVCVTPADAQEQIASLVHDVEVAPQSEGDLGLRMFDAFIAGFESGARAVVVIGSDLPTLPRSHLEEAFRQLETGADSVFGPADDGGYYLVGISARCVTNMGDWDLGRQLFSGVIWGSDAVLQQSLAAASRAGLSAELISAWYDVDRPEDLMRVLADTNASATRTRAWCRQFSP